jgi:hypothetical protein
MFWREFPTKNALEEAIRAIVDPQPFNDPFESPLISDLVSERHYFCSLRALRPSHFRKIRGNSPYKFQGDFSGLPTSVPLGWHTVSWKKCVIPPLTEWDRIVRAMRDRIEPEKARYKKSHPTCEDCGQKPSKDAHHANPPFQSISDSLRSRVSDAEVAECLAGWDWFSPDNFALPMGNKLTVIFDQLHANAELRALCRECHNKTKGRKPRTNDGFADE